MTLIVQCLFCSTRWEDPKGIPIDAIILGGRRPEGVPLVMEAFSWQHGVMQGALLKSETTAVAEHKGMANLFILTIQKGLIKLIMERIRLTCLYIIHYLCGKKERVNLHKFAVQCIQKDLSLPRRSSRTNFFCLL